MILFTIEDIVRILLEGKNGHSINGLHEVLIEISKDIKLIYKQNQKIMEKLELHLAALQKIDDATTAAGAEVTRIGDRITALEQAIKDAGLTADQENQLLAHTQGIGDRAVALASALTQMGKTPENPVPVEPPINGEGGGGNDNAGGTL
jgi:predicted  nucleic acid-binding Zn-ribbon protein